MKTLFLFTLTLVLTLNLNARENPFEATNAYEEEAARIIEQNEIDENAINESAYIKEMQEKMSNVSNEDTNKNKVEEAIKKLTPALKVEKTYTKKEVDKLIQKTKVQTENRTKQIVKKELKKTTAVKPKQIVYVKPRTDIIDEEMKTKKISTFINIEYNDSKLIIHSKDNVSKKFTIEKENKIIIDYKAKKNFYTKRAELDSTNFKKIAVGNHKKENFYRVVIQLNDAPSNYKVEYKDKLITIIQINIVR
ncbi:AMIN domain-containing protein [Poseidonibacter antarcticus]|uniref:AMIN domain-containing protein n=1 Tax=Poseidonibacter antarcticus TaxID=2478538 RepID=UPI000EF48916|nr:AMIN domain-containing protein [Poseidonibacter antarcticus]